MKDLYHSPEKKNRNHMYICIPGSCCTVVSKEVHIGRIVDKVAVSFSGRKFNLKSFFIMVTLPTHTEQVLKNVLTLV